MSRTSRRISRPLIAGLTVVIALGVAFTVHKIHKAHAAATPPKVAVSTDTNSAAPVAPKRSAAVNATPAPGAVAEASHPDSKAVVVDSSALITQTPTEKPAGDSNSARPASTASPLLPPAHSDAVTTPNPSPTQAVTEAPEKTDNDTVGLEQWAKGTKTVQSSTPTTPIAVATAGQASTPVAPVHAVVSSQPLVDAKAKQDAGDLIGARQILNDALIAAHGDADALKKQIEEINQTLIFSARKFPDDPWGGSYQVASGERLGTIANRSSVTWEFLSRINGITPKRLRSGQNIKLVKGPFFAVVYKHLFKMELYLGAPGGEGSMYIRSFQVGLGKDNSTPTGLWMCKSGDKIRSPRYYPPHGGDVIAPDDPKNPLGGYWIAIEGLEGQALGAESFGIHGTIDPNSIGKMESMGCIRLRAEDISWVFDMLVDGKSKVLVKD
jgi:hypothetical protein